jgi:N-methylhydantoinase A
VRVDVPDGSVDQALLDTVAGRFHDEHRALYDYDFRGDDRQQVEWVNLRVTGVGPIRKPPVQRAARGQGAAAARTGTRRVYFDDWVDAAVHDRSRLGAGDTLAGPAVLEEFSSTVPLHPGFTARVDDYGNLVITRSSS